MEVKNISIAKIQLANNNRNGTEKNKLAELQESISQVGLLQPIGITEKGKGKYEIVYGFRRLEAFKGLKKKEIPAVILRGDDLLAMQITENLQREDLKPMELARAIAKYQKESELTSLTDIAKVLGKTLREISLLNKLNSLYKPLIKLLEENILNLDAALYVAKYPEPEQKAVFESHSRDEKILISDTVNFFSDRNYKVNSFPWNMDKAFKGLPTCSKCTDRSSCQNVLFPIKDNPDDTCLNKQCMLKKIDMNIPDVIKETKKLGKTIFIDTEQWYSRHKYDVGDEKVYLPDSVRKASDKQKEFVHGIVIASDSVVKLGSVHKCTIVNKSSGPGKSSKTRLQDLPIEQQNKRRIDNFKRKKDLTLFPLAGEVGKEITKKIKKVDYKKIKTVPIDALAIIADYVLDEAGYGVMNDLSKIYNPKKDKKNLAKIYLMLVTAATYEPFHQLNVEGYARSDEYRRLREFAPVLGIDVKAIEKNIKPKFDEKVISLKERFIGRNKFDPDKGLPIKI